MNTEYTMMYGKHAVHEVLTVRPDIVKMVYTMATFNDTGILALMRKAKIQERELNPKRLPKNVSSDAVHQGIIAEIDAEKLMLSLEDFVRDTTIINTTALVLLGEIQDPHNVGAIIRSAAAFGVAGVLIPTHRQTQITGSVIKVSAGTAFRVPLISITNVNHTIAELKKLGFWIYGLDGAATTSLQEEHFEKPSVFILGNEATGIRQKTLEHCDISLRIPLSSEVESLNASVAAAVVLYAWSVQHAQ
jgi:23S rRNA (guanosine2251-2'-O)-methyltransferase